MDGSYNSYGQPLLGTSSVINSGAPLSDSSAAALQRPFGERANGGYMYANGGPGKGIQKDAKGYYIIDPSWPMDKQRKVNARNFQLKNAPGSGMFDVVMQPQRLPQKDNRHATQMANWQAGRQQGGQVDRGTMQGGNVGAVNGGGAGAAFTEGSYNPNGQPLLGTSSPINSGAGLTPDAQAALQRPFGDRAYGGYMARGGYYANGGLPPTSQDYAAANSYGNALMGAQSSGPGAARQPRNPAAGMANMGPMAGMGGMPAMAGTSEMSHAAQAPRSNVAAQAASMGSAIGGPWGNLPMQRARQGSQGYAYGGYPVHAQENRLTGRNVINHAWRNGQKVSFFANGGYQSGTISNMQPNGDFDLI